MAMFKMTYGAPLAMLMLARGQWRGVGYGVMLAGMMSLPIVGALVRSAGGIEAFLAQGRDGYSAWRAGYGDAAEVPLRVDAAAVIARVTGYGLGSAGELLVAAALVALGAVLIRRLRPTETNDRGPASAGIASLVMVLAVYRQPYDLLLLVLPLTALTAVISRRGGVREAPSHALVLGLLLIPMANYFTFGAGASLLGLSILERRGRRPRLAGLERHRAAMDGRRVSQGEALAPGGKEAGSGKRGRNRAGRRSMRRELVKFGVLQEGRTWPLSRASARDRWPRWSGPGHPAAA
jgi:hypothetical protein